MQVADRPGDISILTHIFASDNRVPDGTGKLYSGMVDCFVKSASNEGPMSLYNGFWPNFGRVVPRVTIVFIVMEQLKSHFG